VPDTSTGVTTNAGRRHFFPLDLTEDPKMFLSTDLHYYLHHTVEDLRKTIWEVRGVVCWVTTVSETPLSRQNPS
jgi:hypothetical protein